MSLMCGRFTLSSPGDVLAEMFELVEAPDVSPRYNIAPTQAAPVVRLHGNTAGRRMESLHWGLIPFWAKDPTIGSRMINARAETVSSKPAFRTAFRQRRCLVIANGFYEWQKLEPGGGKSRPRKLPHYIHMRDERPFALAGLWEHWEGPEGSVIDSCTIITTQPNEVVAPLHDRMPVILGSKDFNGWLDPKNRKLDELQDLLRPYAPNEMEAYPVSTLVNSPANDSPDCICR